MSKGFVIPQHLEETKGEEKVSGGAFDWASGFTQSAVAGLGELVGIDPSKDVLDYRAENPVGGFSSQLIGFGVPYLGWEAAALKIPRLMKVAGSAEAAFANPFLAGAAKEMVKLAPFEVARQAGNLAVGDQTPGEMLKDNLLSLGIGGVAGGLVNSFAKTARTLDSLEGFVTPDDPLQFQLRQLLDIDKEGAFNGTPLDAVQQNRIKRGIIERAREIREETGKAITLVPDKNGNPQRVVRYTTGLGDQDATRTIARMAARGKKLTLSDYGSDAAWRQDLLDAGVDPVNFEAYAKTPRVLAFKKDGGPLFTSLDKVGTQAAPDTWVAREGEDGLYLVAKKFLSKEEKPKTKVLLFKTDTPDRFAPGPARWTNQQDRISAYKKDLEAQLGHSRLLDVNLKTLGSVSGLRGDTKTKNALVEAIGNTLDKTVVPKQLQLRRSQLGRAALMSMQASHDLGQQWAREQIWGKKVLDETKSALGQILFGNFKADGKGLMEVLEDAAKENGGKLPGIDRVLLEEIPHNKLPDLYVKGELSKGEFEALNMMHNIQATLGKNEIFPLQRLTGVNKYKELQGHYGIPRTRPGDHRIGILDENGNVVYFVGGENQKVVTQLAEGILDGAKAEGKSWARSEPMRRDEGLEADLLAEYSNFGHGKTEDRTLARRLFQKQLRQFAGSRNFRERTDVKGFLTEWTPETLAEAADRHLQNKVRYAASLASRHAISQYADKLRLTAGQHAFDVVDRRLKDFEGTPGPIAKATNEFLDKAVGPIIGKNSATKIASAVNKWFMHLSFGAGNLAYPALNAVGFLQNVLPHISFVKNAPRELLGNYYDAVVLNARDGVQGAFSLSPMKLAYQSTKNLRSKDPRWMDVVNRAVNDGTADPKFIENYVGETANEIKKFQANMKSPTGWANTLKGLSMMMMESGERFSRMHALSAGYLVGKDFLRLRGDELYKFAKRFTDNTMYRYAVPDRPTLFAGPVGSVFGLFKNWMMHYTLWMLEHMRMVGNNPTSMAAWGPLLWQVGGTTAVGGIGAWPLMSLANGLSKFASDQSIMEHTYRNLTLQNGDETYSDAMYYGLPSLLGLSLSAQAQMPFSAPLADAEFLMVPVQWSRMQALGRAIGDSADRFTESGQFNPLDSQKLTLNWAQALAPKTVYRALQAQTDGMIRSGRTGMPLVQNIGTMDRIAYGLGLTPTEVARTYEVANQLYAEQEARKRTVEVLGQEWKEAQGAGDYRAVQDVMRRSILMGIDPSSVVRSAAYRLSRERGDMIDSAFTPEAIWRNRSSLPQE